MAISAAPGYSNSSLGYHGNTIIIEGMIVGNGKYVLIALGVVVVSLMAKSCDGNNSYTAMDYAKDRISSLMKDPDSAKFESVTFHQTSEGEGEPFIGYVCGYVNAKNSFGAYTGNKAFIVKTKITNDGKTIATSDVVMDDGQVSNFQALVDKRCK
ncbi:TPA: hypothetical protein R9C75_000724 [Escherichia coli]|nr:hypothetical protein [Escherichia coli]